MHSHTAIPILRRGVLRTYNRHTNKCGHAPSTPNSHPARGISMVLSLTKSIHRNNVVQIIPTHASKINPMYPIDSTPLGSINLIHIFTPNSFRAQHAYICIYIYYTFTTQLSDQWLLLLDLRTRSLTTNFESIT